MCDLLSRFLGDIAKRALCEGSCFFSVIAAKGSDTFSLGSMDSFRFADLEIDREKATAHCLRKGVQVASRIETRAALRQLSGGRGELALLDDVPFHQQETALYLSKHLRGLWLAARNAGLTDAADRLEEAVWECAKALHGIKR